MKELAERGKFWNIDDWDSGELLAALVVYPARPVSGNGLTQFCL